jgi:hypothetical protein
LLYCRSGSQEAIRSMSERLIPMSASSRSVSCESSRRTVSYRFQAL